MREIIELRVAEEFAHLLFGDTEGLRLSNIVRKVTLSTSDPRYQQVGELQRRLSLERNESFFFGWIIRRRYTMAELRRAEFFSVEWTSTFEPPGEDCGTVYDDTVACQHTYVAGTTTLIPGAGNVTIGPYTCGMGTRQLTPLILDGRRIPQGKDFARMIASEEIVSERVKSVFEGLGITGVAFEPVQLSRSSAETRPVVPDDRAVDAGGDRGANGRWCGAVRSGRHRHIPVPVQTLDRFEPPLRTINRTPL